MDNKKTIKHSMQGVFVFVLLGLFAVMSTLMVLMGAQMYRATVENANSNGEDRLLNAYVRSMVRSEDAEGSVKIESVGGLEAIALYETIDDEDYVTRLYQYDGQLYEQFTEVSFDFDPSMGMPICPIRAFKPTINGGLLSVKLVDEKDNVFTVQVALRSAL